MTKLQDFGVNYLLFFLLKDKIIKVIIIWGAFQLSVIMFVESFPGKRRSDMTSIVFLFRLSFP